MINEQRKLMLDILPVLVSEDGIIESTDDVDMDTLINELEYSTEFIDLLATYEGSTHDDVEIAHVISDFMIDSVDVELSNEQTDEIHEHLSQLLSDVLC